MTSVKETTREFEIVEIKNIMDEKINKEHIGKLFYDLSADEDEEYLYFESINSSDAFGVNKELIEYETVGKIQVPQGQVRLLHADSYKFIAENTQNDVLFLGRVSEIHNFRVLQLTENLVVAYTSVHSNDKGKKESGPFADIYFYQKIGNIKEMSVYIYVNDMVLKDRENELKINWVGAFVNSKGNSVSNPVVSKIK